MKTYSLTITNPCSEKWENFSLTSTGGFCSSCSKTVVDFTGKSDQEIATYFAARPVYVCGKFQSKQLKAYAQRPPVRLNTGLTLLKAGFVCLILAIVQRPAVAQDVQRPATEQVVKQKSLDDHSATVSRNRSIRGVVVNESDHSPLPGFNVILEGFTVGTTTDEKGNFIFPQKLQEGDVLLFSFIGYKTQRYTVPKETTNDLNVVINISEHDLEIMGDVAVNDVYEEPSGVHKLWNKVKAKF